MEHQGESYYLEKVQGGDTQSFRWIVDHYKEMVYTICLRMLTNEADAEEAAQEVFIKSYRAIRSFQGNSKFSTWLYRITYNHCISVIRKKVKMIDLVDEIPDNTVKEETIDGMSELDRKEREKYIKEAIEALPETDAVIITLFYLKELSLEEIGDITGMTSGNIRLRLHRSRKKLYEILSKKLKSEIESIL